MQGFSRYVALMLAVAGLTLAVAACSGSGGGGDSGDGDTAAYTNDTYGFSLTYDRQLTEGEPVEGTGAGGSSVFDVVFADKDGAVIADRYVDALQVSVYELAREVKPSEVPGLKKELSGVVDQLMGSLATAKVVQPLEQIEVNGVPGFAFKYTYTEDDTEMTAVTFFLFNGKYEYQITAQATTENWTQLKGKLETAVQTFAVK